MRELLYSRPFSVVPCVDRCPVYFPQGVEGAAINMLGGFGAILVIVAIGTVFKTVVECSLRPVVERHMARIGAPWRGAGFRRVDLSSVIGVWIGGVLGFVAFVVWILVRFIFAGRGAPCCVQYCQDTTQ